MVFAIFRKKSEKPELRSTVQPEDEPQEPESSSSVESPLEDPTEEPNSSLHQESTALTTEKKLFQAIKNFREEMEKLRYEAIAEQQRSISEAEKRIAYAQEIISETRIDKSLLTLLKEMWSWPVWSKQDAFDSPRELGLSQVSADESRDAGNRRKIVKFTLDDTKYRFEFEEEEDHTGMFDDNTFGSIRLFGNDTLLVSISVIYEFDLYTLPHEWNYTGVDTLQVGAWMKDIVELEQRIVIKEEKISKQFEEERAWEKAERLPKPE